MFNLPLLKKPQKEYPGRYRTQQVQMDKTLHKKWQITVDMQYNYVRCIHCISSIVTKGEKDAYLL